MNIQKGCGAFEIIENDTVVASGRIKKLEKTEITYDDIKIIETDISDKVELPLQTADIYKDYRLRGYQYKGKFVGISRATYDGTYTKLTNHEFNYKFL